MPCTSKLFGVWQITHVATRAVLQTPRFLALDLNHVSILQTEVSDRTSRHTQCRKQIRCTATVRILLPDYSRETFIACAMPNSRSLYPIAFRMVPICAETFDIFGRRTMRVRNCERSKQPVT